MPPITEIAPQNNIQSQSPVEQKVPGTCPVCHLPVQSSYYFCPNCGAKLNMAPLSITSATQAWIYALSFILPWTVFIFIKWWPGIKYAKSHDPKTKQIGQIAWAILIISTLVTIWFAYVWTQNTIKSTINSINSDMSLP